MSLGFHLPLLPASLNFLCSFHASSGRCFLYILGSCKYTLSLVPDLINVICILHYIAYIPTALLCYDMYCPVTRSMIILHKCIIFYFDFCQIFDKNYSPEICMFILCFRSKLNIKYLLAI